MPFPLAPASRRPAALAALSAALLFSAAFAPRLVAADAPPATTAATPAPDPTTLEIQRLLRSFREVGTVLYVAAHPDDENTEFITYFARARGYRTAYLSLTRGDGGQNQLGSDFSEKLGLLRTQELLAARRIDGGRQFFTRAIDFGFSKTPDETLRFWNHDAVLADVVRVIRQFQPDVIVTRFPVPPGSGGHGHHTASAMLAVEAFKLAGDPKAFPEQLAEGLTPWQPKRVLWNVFSWGRDNSGLTGPTVELDIGGHDPLTDESLGTIANLSRGQHKTQMLGGFVGRAATGPNVQTFRLLAGDAPERDLFDGVDLTWARVPGGAALAPLAADLAAKFDPQNPAASIPAILALRAKLAALPASALVTDKRAQLDRLLQLSLGLEVTNTVADAALIPGEEFRFHTTVTLRAAVPVRWLGATYPDSGPAAAPVDLRSDAPTSREFAARISPHASLSQPYWLREPGAAGIYTVSEPGLIGRPENPPDFPVGNTFEIDGQLLTLAGTATSTTGRSLEIVSPVPLTWTRPLELLAPGTTRTVTLELTAARAGVHGRLQLECPPGWKIAPETRDFTLGAVGERLSLAFELTAPASPSTAQIAVRAAVGERRYHRSRVELRYAHLPVLLLQPDAPLTAVAADIAIRAKKIGYVPGAGDDTPAALRRIGCEVTELTTAEDLAPERLSGLDAVVIGIRAYEENKILAAALPALFAYAEKGGTVVAQYTRPSTANKDQPIGPYPLTIAGSGPQPQYRVTDETAPVTFLTPDHPALNSPNKITAADFAAWVQERGAYFPSAWDESHYTAILAMNDPDSPPLRSSLLVAKHGQGWFVYTGLSFFRQLPAGNPGAYRLFANLVSLGK